MPGKGYRDIHDTKRVMQNPFAIKIDFGNGAGQAMID